MKTMKADIRKRAEEAEAAGDFKKALRLYQEARSLAQSKGEIGWIDDRIHVVLSRMKICL